MKYDSSIIQQFADNLYARAKTIIVTYAVVGLVIGLAAGTAVFPPIGTIIGGIVLGYFGYTLGKDKAFHLKLEAQIALCQTQIERNTRNDASPEPVFVSEN